MKHARALKNDGNDAYRLGDGLKAADKFHEAGEHVKDLLEQELDASDAAIARRLLAVCYANRAMVWLMPGKIRDLRRCVEDALKAEDSDPSYSKAYLRQSRGYQGLGEFDKAMDTVARALSREDLKDDMDLSQALIVLQTDGRGLPVGISSMEEWKRTILTGNPASMKRMSSVPVTGAWFQKVEAHLASLVLGSV
ncbi:hypothetical protein BDP27DRAFT_1281539 [Rhodocollybia butyracea]|uniref:Uncharacterized protein n=1 Tax=Rhodocollybia butyracea TaxID=206335 RepID=A0A9P5UFX6_9AGAR|nr:hypothetical protein BDP27DRAFT_1281539 [Rhodocollybia butyracea]